MSECPLIYIIPKPRGHTQCHHPIHDHTIKQRYCHYTTYTLMFITYLSQNPKILHRLLLDGGLSIVYIVHLFRLLKVSRIIRIRYKYNTLGIVFIASPTITRLFKLLGIILFVAHLIRCCTHWWPLFDAVKNSVVTDFIYMVFIVFMPPPNFIMAAVCGSSSTSVHRLKKIRG